MKTKITILLLLLTVIFTVNVKAQLKGNARQKYVAMSADTIVIDTLSIIPGSVSFFLPDGAFFAKPGDWKLDEAAARVVMPRSGDQNIPDSLLVVYKVFPILFTRTYRNKDRSVIEKSFYGLYNPFSYGEGDSENNIFKMEGLQHNGNISRGISFGNNQDVVVNSSFNLQLSGKINDDVEILAAITDNNIPVQPEGNTQQIQDFDKVFIQLSRNKTKLLVGDFELRRPESYFMNFFKKAQGGLISTAYQPGVRKDQQMRTTVSGAISKGKFARNVFNGLEANQGPYRLFGT